MSRAAAGAATAAAHTAGTSTSPRVLHIRAHPTPVTMAARQRVLAALESFGEVEHFRSLKVCYFYFILFYFFSWFGSLLGCASHIFLPVVDYVARVVIRVGEIGDV